MVVSTVLLEVKAERQLCSLEQKGGYLGARFHSSEEQTGAADAGGYCLTSRWRTEQVQRSVVHFMALDNVTFTL